MREILFRGYVRSIENPRWIEGDLVRCGCSFAIIRDYETGEQFEVSHNTVGQFSGLVDCNGAYVFEGDIIQADGFAPLTVEWDEYKWVAKNDTIKVNLNCYLKMGAIVSDTFFD